MTKTVYKENLVRQIPLDRLEEFLAAGWRLEPQAADVINLKPATRARAVVKPEPGDAINQGE